MVAPLPLPKIVGVLRSVEEKFSIELGLKDFFPVGIVKIFKVIVASKPPNL